MDRKGFIDEINPIYIALCLMGGVICFIATRHMGMTFRVIVSIVAMIIGYIYLVMTE